MLCAGRVSTSMVRISDNQSEACSWHGVVLDVFTNNAGKTILRVQTVRNVFRRLNPEFIEFDLAPDAIEPATSDDLQAEVASYEATLQQSIREMIRYAQNGEPYAESSD